MVDVLWRVSEISCVLVILELTGIKLNGYLCILTGDDTAPLPSNAIRAHPDFRMIVLANRPGFPFLGNDFFGSLGETFLAILLSITILSSWADFTQPGLLFFQFWFSHFSNVKNTPGWPSLLFSFNIGDIFSCHAVDNPDFESEMVSSRFKFSLLTVTQFF